jgi:hypothetical protein
VPDRGGLSRLEIGVVGGECRARPGGVPRQRGDLGDERVVQVADRAPGGQAEPDAKRLAARPACAQPARSRPPDPPFELRLAGVEGVAERRVPPELVAGDRVQLEQAAQEPVRIVARQVAALDQRHRVRQIGKGEPVREPRAVSALSGICSRDQLTGRIPPQPSAAAQLLGLGHPAEPRELGATRAWDRATLVP